MRSSVELRGINRVRNQLRYLVNRFKHDVDVEIKSFAEMAASQLYKEPYPPPPPPTEAMLVRRQPQYERTFKLKSGWIAKQQGEAHWIVTNLVPYSGWVVGRDTQTAVHQGRWWIAEDVVQEMVETDLTPSLAELLERKLAEQQDE